MSAADERELQDVAEDLIEEFGRVVQLVAEGVKDVSDTEPWKGKTGPGESIDVSAVFQAMNKELVPGTAIQIGDSLAIIKSKGLAGREITAADRLVDGTRQWAIIAPVESRPGNTSFVWFLHVRDAGA
jgi:hypothetical protein